MNFKPEKTIADRAEEIINGGNVEDFLRKSMPQEKKSGTGSIPFIGDKLSLAERLDLIVGYFKCHDVPMSKKVMIMAMVIYMFIPNLPIPFYIDELLVCGLLIKKIHKELDAFERGEYSGNPNVIDMKALPSTKENPFLKLDDVVVKEEVKENPFLNI